MNHNIGNTRYTSTFLRIYGRFKKALPRRDHRLHGIICKLIENDSTILYFSP